MKSIKLLTDKSHLSKRLHFYCNNFFLLNMRIRLGLHYKWDGECQIIFCSYVRLFFPKYLMKSLNTQVCHFVLLYLHFKYSVKQCIIWSFDKKLYLLNRWTTSAKTMQFNIINGFYNLIIKHKHEELIFLLPFLPFSRILSEFLFTFKRARVCKHSLSVLVYLIFWCHFFIVKVCCFFVTVDID